MEFNENTKLIDILNKYPGLEPKLLAMDPRFKVISTGIGKRLMKKNTVKDASKIIGMPTNVILEELDRLIKDL